MIPAICLEFPVSIPYRQTQNQFQDVCELSGASNVSIPYRQTQNQRGAPVWDDGIGQFQFLIGRLKTWEYCIVRIAEVSFNSLQVDSKLQCFFSFFIQLPESFNSLQVDSKLKYYNRPISRLAEVSIPYRQTQNMAQKEP